MELARRRSHEILAFGVGSPAHLSEFLSVQGWRLGGATWPGCRGYILKDCRVGQEFGTKIQEDRGKALL